MNESEYLSPEFVFKTSFGVIPSLTIFIKTKQLDTRILNV